MDEVIDIDFELSGSAGVNSEGLIRSLNFDMTDRDGKAHRITFEVPVDRSAKNSDERFAMALADAIEVFYGDEIAHKLDDWDDSAKVPDYDANEAV